MIINELPIEILSLIINKKHFTYRQFFGILVNVCSIWYNIIKNHKSYQKIISFANNIQNFVRSEVDPLSLYDFKQTFYNQQIIKDPDMALVFCDIFSNNKFCFNSLKLWTDMTNINALPIYNNIKKLDLGGLRHVEDFSSINRLTNLKKISFWDCKKLTNLDCIKNCLLLEELDFYCCTNLIDISSIQNLIHLKILDFSYCKKLNNITPVKHLKFLEVLKLVSCTNLKNLQFLKECISINFIDISRTIINATSLQFNNTINIVF